MKKIIIAFTILVAWQKAICQDISFDREVINFGDTLSLVVKDKSLQYKIDLNKFKNTSISIDTNAIDSVADIILIPNPNVKLEAQLLNFTNTDRVQFIMLSVGKFVLPITSKMLTVEVKAPSAIELAEIKPIEEVKGIVIIDILKYLIPILFLIPLLFYLYKKWMSRPKTKPLVENKQIELSPYEKALHALNELKDNKLYESLELKEFQTRLGDILKLYLDDEFFINATQSTTGELIDKCKELGFKSESTNILLNVLSLSDLVKFAKAKPGSEVCHEAVELSITFLKNSRK
jgi:hypothetical protein